MLIIGPSAILILATLLFSLIVIALVLASKNKSNMRFLIWGVFILSTPFVGAVSCIISHYFGRKVMDRA
ncbi:MAG: hypothetical protein ACI6PN_10015 [Polaribacter sp.]|uniref:hypothetical protein n=1 Tax=Polaribacter sp. TaxID=1920175 RepID=UPI00384C579D